MLTNPVGFLSLVAGMNDLMLETHLAHDQRTFAEQIRSSAEGLLSLINDIVDLTNIERGKLEQKKTDFDLRAVIEEAVDSVSINGISAGLEICSFVDPTIPTLVHGDGDRLRQMLSNLLANGVKFTQTGGVYLSMLLEEDHETQAIYSFAVEDTGPGIAPADLENLFDPNHMTSRAGLGLAMAHKMARLLHGELLCHSTLGKGSTMKFTAKFDKVSAKFMPMELKAEQRGKRALVVAAGDRLRESIVATVSSLGLAVDAVASLSEIQNRASGQDVVIVCPSILRAGRAEQDDDLLEYMKQLADSALPVATVMLCPITQLGHAASTRKETGAECTIVSRPVRLSVLVDVISHCLEPGSAGRVAPFMFHTPAAHAAASPAIHQDGGGDDDDELMGDMRGVRTGRVQALRMLLAVSADLKSSLRGHLVGAGHACDVCSSANEVSVIMTDIDGSSTYDSVVLDLKLLGAKSLDLVKLLHSLQRRQDHAAKRMILVGVMDQDDKSQDSLLWAAALDAVITLPVTNMKVQHALTTGAAAASARLQEGRLRSSSPESTSRVPKSSPARGSAGLTPPPVMTPPEQSGPADDDQALDQGVRRVLVVEDDAGQQRVLKSFLSKDGFEVEIAKDGDACIAAVEASRFHLVLLKAALPGKAGWDVAKELRVAETAVSRARPVPIIGILSAGGGDEEEARCRSAGIGAALAKPIKKDALLQMCHACLAEAAAAQPATTIPPPAAAAAGRQSSGGLSPGKVERRLKILVVDDDAGQRLMLKAMLTRDEHTVDVADNGGDAVKLAAKNSYHVILLDGFMPIVNGWDACRQIRKHEVDAAASTAAVIFGISASETGADVDNFATAGVTTSLSKPISRDVLRAKMTAALAAPRAPFLPPPGASQTSAAGKLTPRHAAAAASCPRLAPAPFCCA